MANTITHPACGKSWVQRGNMSGHCSKCHETFYGMRAFDRHQTHDEDGKVVCHDPASGDRGPWYQDAGGQWRHGKPMTAEQKAKLKEQLSRSSSKVTALPTAAPVVEEQELPQAA